MRKLLLAFLAISIVSCVGDSDPSGDANQAPRIVSLQNSIYTDGVLNFTQELEFNYTNGKLTKVVNNQGNESDFFYESDKLIKVEAGISGETHHETNFTYTGNQLTGSNAGTMFESAISTYGYSGNNLSTIDWEIFIDDGTHVTGQKQYTFDAHGNLTQMIYTSDSNTRREVHTYDEQKNPTLNMNQYVRFLYEDAGFGFEGLSAHNKTSTMEYIPADATTPTQYDYEITYNADGYPTQISKYKTEGHVIQSTTQITYE